MPIQNIIVHEVRKEEDQNEAEVLPRDEENEIDAHSEKLGSELSKLFKKTGLNTGQFTMPEHDNDAQPHFVTLLKRYFEDNQFIDFVGFSQAAAREFKKKLDEAATSKGGYLWFNHYTHNDEHFLSIVLLRKKNGLLLSNDLTLDKIEQLDLDKLHMAARINLSAWLEGNSTRFIAFRIGRGAKNVTDYFSKFIGCEEYTRVRVDTQNLVRATKNYCSLHDFDDIKTEEAKQFVFEQCISRLD